MMPSGAKVGLGREFDRRGEVRDWRERWDVRGGVRRYAWEVGMIWEHDLPDQQRGRGPHSQGLAERILQLSSAGGRVVGRGGTINEQS